MIHVLKSTYLKPPDVVEQTRPAHLEFLNDEIAAGRLLLAGRQEDGSGGVLITGDISTEDAQDLVARDPYTGAGVATYERPRSTAPSEPQGSRSNSQPPGLSAAPNRLLRREPHSRGIPADRR